jgi:hypothetical protein
MAGALVVLFGACYAASLAWGRLYRHRGLLALAIASVVLLAASLFVLARTLHLEGGWRVLVVLLLLAYVLAPPLIWRLARATHGAPLAESNIRKAAISRRRRS